MKIYKSDIPLYIKLYTNRIEICRLDTDQCKSIIGEFSHSRVLFADFDKAEQMISSIVKELTKEYWLRPSTIAAVQQMEITNGGLTGIEKKSIYHSVEIAAFARKIEIVESNYELTKFEVLKILNKRKNALQH